MIKKIVKRILSQIEFFETYLRFRMTPYHNRSFWGYLRFRLSRNKTIYWPRCKTNTVILPENLVFGKNSSLGGSGCYIQCIGEVIIGENVWITTNVGIISANHALLNQTVHIRDKVVIGDYSWIGMNSVILPGVELGPRTIVGAGSVVTKSFPEGFCVIAGNPAKKIKNIDEEDFIPAKYSEYDFYGYIPAEKFEIFKAKYLTKKN